MKTVSRMESSPTVIPARIHLADARLCEPCSLVFEGNVCPGCTNANAVLLRDILPGRWPVTSRRAA
jgi:hypothetical protein